MKLFLSSYAVSEGNKAAFAALVGKPLAQIRMALIENAADPYPPEKSGFVRETREIFEKLGLQIEPVDLRGFRGKSAALLAKLRRFDVVWAGGGNTYYLRWIMEVVGFAGVMGKLLAEGAVYGGGSAGALVAGKMLKYFDAVDGEGWKV